jgi:ADP-ribosylglycohydrolase
MIQFAMRHNNVIKAIDAARSALWAWERSAQTPGVCAEVDAALAQVVESHFAPDAKTDPASMESMGDSNTALGALAIGTRAVISDHRFEHVVGRAIVIDGDSAATGLVAGTFFGIAAGTNRLPDEAYGQIELADRMRTLAHQVTREFGEKPPNDDDFYSWFPYDKRLTDIHSPS